MAAVEPVDASGPVEAAVTADLVLWGADGALAALAVTLAKTLDAGAGLSTAAVARELRATLADLAPKVDDDADRDAALIADLSTPVDYSKN